MNKRKINFKRKDQFNKKLALQVVFSIMLVAAVIFAKQYNTSLTSDFIQVTEEKMTESIEPKTVKDSIFQFFGGIRDKIPFLAKDGTKDNVKDNDEYASPVNGTILQKYGLNKENDSSYYNHGIDILSNTESVKSISEGKVGVVGSNDKLGNYVVIEQDGKTIIYGKISEAFVKKGEEVSKGDIIGALGEEDKMLHLEIWEDGESINPAKLFEINE